MAKKKAAAGFNMSEEIRNILSSDPKLTGRETVEVLKAKFPGEKINDNSASVAYSSARKKLGLPPVRRRKGGARKVVRRKLPTAPRPSVNIALLQAAMKFLSEAGSADAAHEAIKQVQALQIK